MYIRSYYPYNNGIIYIEIGLFNVDDTYPHVRMFFVINVRLSNVEHSLIFIGWSNLHRNMGTDKHIFYV